MSSYMKNLLPFLLLAFSLNTLATEQPEIGRYVNAYAGEENTSVYVVRFGPVEDAQALVLVEGIDNKLDGVVQKASITNDSNGGRSYRIPNTDGYYEILRLDREQGSLLLSAQPNGLNNYRVRYSSELSRDARAEHILSRWLEQQGQ